MRSASRSRCLPHSLPWQCSWALPRCGSSRIVASNESPANRAGFDRRYSPRHMPVHHLAQLNVALAVGPLDGEQMADFMNSLDEINALGENSPGFVWRLKS